MWEEILISTARIPPLIAKKGKAEKTNEDKAPQLKREHKRRGRTCLLSVLSLKRPSDFLVDPVGLANSNFNSNCFFYPGFLNVNFL